ncbi:MAG: PQQ-binding-like beta-propeller repeat protein [Planctomycetaceae bacterium]
MRLTTFVVTLLACATALHAEDWPSWRGPLRNGISAETDLPTTWSATENIKWKTPLPGLGIASPVIWGDRIYLTESDGKRLNTLHVICLDRKTGTELWRRKFWGTAPTLYHGSKSSMATPVPVTDGEFIYAFFGTGDVFCLSSEGELMWQRSLANEYGVFENRFAASSSPILHENLLILQCDHYGDSYVLAIDKATGTNVWKADRPECWLSWASPQLLPAGEGHPAELLVSGSHKMDAYDPLSGERKWTITGLERECIPTPLFGHGMAYVVSGPKGFTFAIRRGGEGDVTDSHVEWKTNRGAPFVPSTILVGDYYYLVDDAGILTCLDAHTGDAKWQKRLNGAFTASPVAGDGKIYFTDEAGTTTVIKADVREYEELARNEIGEPGYASLAISQGNIYIRTPSGLFCVGSDIHRK